jgi:hypothetical protein
MMTRLLLISIIALTPALSGGGEIPYTLQDGVLQVFGHAIRSDEIRNIEDESFVSFSEAPNKRWVVIGYDEPFEKTLVWLYDRTTKVAPVVVKANRVGKHFGVDWYGDTVFAVFWAGMGYKTSQLFKVTKPDVFTQVTDLIVYNPGRDIYARYAFDKDDNHFVFVGRAFHKQYPEEKYLIKLSVEDLLTASDSIEVQFGSDSSIVTYEGEKGSITESHKSKLVKDAKPGT